MTDRQTDTSWLKKGLIYSASGKNIFDLTHCHKPTPLDKGELIRIYFGVRDNSNITRTTYIDVSKINPKKVAYVHDKPVLDIGVIGAFDDSGANVSCVLNVGNKIYMYFIGWNPSTTVHTRNSIGLAISDDGGDSFYRAFEGPVLDRNHFEPFYTGAVDVLYIDGMFHMWYTSGKAWKLINNKPEISYHIKYAYSDDGINWNRDNHFCITPEHEYEVTARPSVIYEKNIYKMWFSKRDMRDFRTNPRMGYRVGYAESTDGKIWTRMDELINLEPSSNLSDFDSEMVSYPYVLPLEGIDLMFYNGNQFGKTGFGYAVRKINN